MNPILRYFCISLLFVALPALASPGLCEQVKAPADDIQQAAARLKQVYDLDVKGMLTPPEAELHSDNKAPETLLDEHKLISPGLLHHINQIGGLDFDILLAAQDWDKSWTIKLGEPVKKGDNYEIAVVLKHGSDQSTVTWKFVNLQGSWVADDARYEEPDEKPFTLRSMEEGD